MEQKASVFIREFPVALRKRIKMAALARDINMRDWILEACQERLAKEGISEEIGLPAPGDDEDEEPV